MFVHISPNQSTTNTPTAAPIIVPTALFPNLFQITAPVGAPVPIAAPFCVLFHEHEVDIHNNEKEINVNIFIMKTLIIVIFNLKQDFLNK